MKKTTILALVAAMLAAGCTKNNDPAPDDYAQQITDAAFKAYCLDEFDTDGDGRLSLDEVMAATEINLFSAGVTTVASLKGIKHFKNLTSLDCSGNQITQLDVSNLTGLTTLDCSGNRISELDVSMLTELTELHCHHNPIRELDVTSNGALERVFCGSGIPEHHLSVSVARPAPAIMAFNPAGGFDPVIGSGLESLVNGVMII